MRLNHSLFKLILLHLLISPFFCQAQFSYEAKGIAMLHLIEQIEWKNPPEKGRFTIGILDEDGKAFRSIDKIISLKKTNQYGKIITKRFKKVDKIKECDALFIVEFNTGDLSEFKEYVHPNNCLIFSEEELLFEQGAHIFFLEKDNRVEYQLNKKELQKSGFTLENSVIQLENKPKEAATETANSNTRKLESAEKFEKSKWESKIKFLENIIKADKIETEKQLDQFALMLDSLNVSVAVKDSLLRVMQYRLRIKNLEKENAQLQKRKFELEIKNELIEKDKKAQANFYYLTILLIITVVISILALIFFLVMRRRKKTIEVINKTNDELAEKVEQIIAQKNQIDFQNKNIQDSLRSAQTIQSAILSNIKIIEKLLPEHFILYRPRDIVSGDFYWFAEVESRQPLLQAVFEPQLEVQASTTTLPVFKPVSSMDYYLTTKIMLAAIDCTGHGVPGAFMSMIGNELLNEIVHRRHIHEPDKILNELHMRVTIALKQQETGNLDGMDAAFCTIEKVISEEKNSIPTFKIEYAGAKRPILYVRNGIVHQINPTNAAIGGFNFHRDKKFVKNTFFVQHPFTLYLFSDGYQDQLSGETRRRFGTEKLKQLLQKIYILHPLEQKRILEDALEQWMGGVSQVDDILLMGFQM